MQFPLGVVNRNREEKLETIFMFIQPASTRIVIKYEPKKIKLALKQFKGKGQFITEICLCAAHKKFTFIGFMLWPEC